MPFREPIGGKNDKSWNSKHLLVWYYLYYIKNDNGNGHYWVAYLAIRRKWVTVSTSLSSLMTYTVLGIQYKLYMTHIVRLNTRMQATLHYHKFHNLGFQKLNRLGTHVVVEPIVSSISAKESFRCWQLRRSLRLRLKNI